jgi:hypothetical protein
LLTLVTTAARKISPIAAAFAGKASTKRILVPLGPMLDRWSGIEHMNKIKFD